MDPFSLVEGRRYLVVNKQDDVYRTIIFKFSEIFNRDDKILHKIFVINPRIQIVELMVPEDFNFFDMDDVMDCDE